VIDYTKTTPWRIGEAYVNAENNVVHPVIDKDCMRVADFYSREDAERACLLAAAAEVQKRRRWKAQRSPGGWFPLDCATGEWPHGLLSFPGTPTKEPAEVLVEADQFLKQQEKGKESP
jgi:hypothetical protein